MSPTFKQYIADLFERFDKGTINHRQLAISLKVYAWAISEGKHV